MPRSPVACRPGAAPVRLVVHVVHRFSVGGLENGVVNLINHMPASRWRHAVVALTEVDPSFASRVQRDDVRFVSLNKQPGQGVWLYRRLWSLFRDWKPDVVHTRNLGTLEFQAPAWAAGVPARVHGEHGRDKDDVDGTNPRHRLLRRLYRPFVHQQIALGSELTQYLRHQVGVPPERITPICNGVDEHRFSPRGGHQPLAGSPFNDPSLFILGTVGRLQPVKAQDDLVRAFVHMMRRHPDLASTARLVLVGDGPLRQTCQALLDEAGLSALAWFAGERHDIPEVMRSFDAFVLPSLMEGISNTILEAMASGLPVIATDVGGNRDLVEPGVTGQLVPPADPPALAAAMAALASGPRLAAAMGASARSAVEARFSMTRMMAAYEQVYDAVLTRQEQLR
jgi:sugar transferase (PEP-CTERM/EpsH1 system associated)